jgi:hypothetical protein
MTQTETMTVRAVLAYAEQLRSRAQREYTLDPYADPYAPSEAAARKVYQAAIATVRLNDRARGIERTERERVHEAAMTAQRELASRVVLQERETRHQRETAVRSEKRHARRQRLDRADHQAAIAQMSLGIRLDRVLQALDLLSEARTQALNEDRVTGSPDRGGLPAFPRPSDRYSALREAARDLVFHLEEELAHARRREIREPIR